MKKIMVLGGDGFCGWPTALSLASKGFEIMIVDNLIRRKIDKNLLSNSLTKIFSIEERIKVANKIIGEIKFKKIDISDNYKDLKKIIKYFNPNSIIHFAEQRSAPYSMINEKSRNYTVENNIKATHNVCSAIVETNRKIHLIHLGSMGVYGYSKIFGEIPEGYLDVIIKNTGKRSKILYPPNPGSIYHMTKCMDQIIFQYYVKNWNLKITDLHQGIVWGINTTETSKNIKLINRFDYDGIYGTVLNRYISQAANNHPLTVYGSGGQTRAFININDTTKCIYLAIKNDHFEATQVRIFNQVSETHNLLQLAKMVSKIFNAKLRLIKNPRKELDKNSLIVKNKNFKKLGFKPILLKDNLLNDIKLLSEKLNDNFNRNKILNSPKW